MREIERYIRQGYLEIAIVLMLWFYACPKIYGKSSSPGSWARAQAYMVLVSCPSSYSTLDLAPYSLPSIIQTCLSGHPSSYPHNSELPFLPMIDIPFGLAFAREHFLQPPAPPRHILTLIFKLSRLVRAPGPISPRKIVCGLCG